MLKMLHSRDQKWVKNLQGSSRERSKSTLASLLKLFSTSWRHPLRIIKEKVFGISSLSNLNVREKSTKTSSRSCFNCHGKSISQKWVIVWRCFCRKRSSRLTLC